MSEGEKTQKHRPTSQNIKRTERQLTELTNRDVSKQTTALE